MKCLLLIASLLMVTAAHAKLVPYQTREEAFKAVPVCGWGPVAIDETRVARIGGNHQIAVTPTGNDSDFVLATSLMPVGLKIHGDVLYSLSDSKIQEFGLTSKALLAQTETIDHDNELGLYQTAVGMDFHGSDLIIAHGGLGYTVYDTTTHKIKDHVMVLQGQKGGAESALTSVVVIGDQAIFTVTQWTLSEVHPAFFGFLVVDLNTNKELRHIQGPDIGSESVVRNGDQLIVGYGMGPMHVFLLQDVLTAKKAPIKKIVMNYSIAGIPLGQPAIADDKMLTCFAKDPVQGAAPGRPEMVPLSIDLSVFQLGR